MSQLNQNSVALEELKTKAASLPAAITIDATLTQEGQAADAKAVGDALAEKTDLINGLHIVNAISTNGVVYTATVPGVTELAIGTSFIMVPTRNSVSIDLKLNVNNLGEKPIRRGSLFDTHVSAVVPAGTMRANSPLIVLYTGTHWNLINLPFLSTTDLDGTFGGAVYANAASQTPNTAMLRNSRIVYAETNPANNGEICWTYK